MKTLDPNGMLRTRGRITIRLNELKTYCGEEHLEMLKKQFNNTVKITETEIHSDYVIISYEYYEQNISILIDEKIRTFYRRNRGEASLITVTPTIYRLLQEQIGFFYFEEHKKQYRGIRIIRSSDLEEGEILVN